MKKSDIDEIFSVFSQINPEPKTELIYTNLFTLLVAVSLSAQTTDLAVNKATDELFKIASNPKDMLNLVEEGLKNYIKTIGLFNNKAKNVIKLSKILEENYGGEVPLNFDELVRLPGVGRKTANVVLNCWLKLPTMPVDTHVFRVAHRIGLSDGKTPEKVEKDLLKIIPKKWLFYAHHWLILHGRYICKAKKPECGGCKINHKCKFYSKNHG